MILTEELEYLESLLKDLMLYDEYVEFVRSHGHEDSIHEKIGAAKRNTLLLCKKRDAQS